MNMTHEKEQGVIPADCDVRKIMLRVDPGSDGMGVEVYAKNVGEVETLLGELSDKVDDPNIVRCVNSHEALVKALQDLTQAVANLDSPEGGLGGLIYLNESAERAESALAAAGAPQ